MSARRTHTVRLIGGQWKRRRLPVADRSGLRPSPDRVRETLFNWLGQDLDGWHVLDAFAGSGALGFEAASRGAAEVVLLERDAELSRSLQASKQRLGAGSVTVCGVDALAWMTRCTPARFHLVLLDPPFHSGLLAAALPLAVPLLVEGGWLYVESDHALAEPPPGLALHRAGRAGVVQHSLWQRRYTAPVESPETTP